MFGLGDMIKGFGSFIGGSVNDTIKTAISQNFTAFVSSLKTFAFEKYKDHLAEGERISLAFIEIDNQIIFLIGVLDNDMRMSKILEKGNLYDLLMSVNYDQILKEMKNAQKEAKDGATE